MSATEVPARTGPADFEKVIAKSDTAVASFEDSRRSPLRHLQHFLHRNPTTIPFIVLLFGALVFSLLVGQRFYSLANLSIIVQQVTIIALVGIGQTLVILTAGIDLSIGAILVLSHVVMGRLAVVYGWPIEIAWPLGLIVGLACGSINGWLVTYLRLPPFIVTLGTLSVFGALNLYFSRSETVGSLDIVMAAPFLQFLGNTFNIGGANFTYGSVLLLVIAAAVWYVLNKTALGRHIYATGDDTEAARLAGINTRHTLMAVYAAAGVIAAIGGWALIGRIGSVSPQSGGTLNIDSITAVVIGGTSLFGGRGSIIGTLFGALIVGVFRSGLFQAGVQVLWQEFAVGLLIIIAVAVDQWIRKVSA